MSRFLKYLRQNPKYPLLAVAVAAVMMAVAIATPLTSDTASAAVWKNNSNSTPSITMTLGSSNGPIGKNIHADCVLKSYSGISNAKVLLSVIMPDGSIVYPKQGSTTTTSSSGKFSIDYVPTISGEHKLTATFNGNSRYNKATAAESFDVKAPAVLPDTPYKAASTIALTKASSSVSTGSGMNIMGVLNGTAPIANALVELKVTTPSGATVYPTQGASETTDSSGRFSICYVPAVAGTYTVTATFYGNGAYDGTSMSVTFSATNPNTEPAPSNDTDTPTSPATPEPTTPVSTSFKYVVTKTDGTYYAKNAVTGKTISSGSNAVTVIQAALNALTPGRMVKEGVLLQGDLTIGGAIVVPSYTVLKLDGKVTATTSNYMITASGSTSQPKTAIEIIGGDWNANKASRIPFYFKYCTDISVSGLKLHDSTNDGMYFLSCSRITVSGTECYNTAGSFCGLVFSNNGLVENNNFHDGGSGIYCYAEDDGIVQDISNVIIRGNIVARTGTTGIEAPSLRGLEDIGDNYLIENNTVIDCGTDGEHPGIMVGWGGFGSVKIRFATNVVVRNNEIYTTGAYVCDQALDYKCASGGKVYGNNIHDAYTVGMVIRGNGNEVYGNTVTGGRTGAPGVELWDASNTYFHDNVLSNIKSTGIWIVVSDGVSAGCNSNIIDHNTMTGVTGPCISISESISTGNIIRNNTFNQSGRISNSGTGTTIQNNTTL
jgi:hypothetical protein